MGAPMGAPSLSCAVILKVEMKWKERRVGNGGENASTELAALSN